MDAFGGFDDPYISIGFDHIEGVMYFAGSQEDEDFIKYHFKKLKEFRREAVKSTRNPALSLLEESNFGISLFAH